MKSLDGKVSIPHRYGHTHIIDKAKIFTKKDKQVSIPHRYGHTYKEDVDRNKVKDELSQFLIGMVILYRFY